MPSTVKWEKIGCLSGLASGLGLGLFFAGSLPADAPFRQQLAVHLAMAALLGAGTGLGFGMFMKRR